ncbi:hypothetical protein SAMN02910356_02083 [Selenomonas sp. GACV-9]|uniref:sel1 repeat family protein n=1 Tax=Selenomonas sp. GACV-9 TaxID=3158782 RepID=UPI0008E0EC6D|nr:hypothetical protein SAMN02910356_02083 [Selenomonas ruminantium]
MAGSKDTFFRYDHEHHAWRETDKPDLSHGDIKKIPFIIIVQFYHECHGTRWEKVWCPEHQAYEAIAGYTAEGVRTETGCELHGWQVLVSHTVYQVYSNEREFARGIFGWRVQGYPDGECWATEYMVEIAFPFVRFHMEEKAPQPPQIIQAQKIRLRIDGPDKNPLPVSLRKWLFPEYEAPPQRQRWTFSQEWLEKELDEEASYYHDRAADKAGWECCINGYNFRQIGDKRAFVNIRKHYEVGYLQPEDLQAKTYFCIERNGRTLCTMVIDGNRITRMEDVCRRDEILRVKVRIVMRKWQEMFGLEYNGGFTREDPRLLAGRQFHIGPVQDVGCWEDTSLRRMLAVPETEQSVGYFLQLYRKTYATDILLRGTVPPEEADELRYLQHQWPFAAKIFQAAEAGEPEAQYVMHLLYADGNFGGFPQPYYRQSAAWYQKALDNGWRLTAPFVDDVIL